MFGKKAEVKPTSKLNSLDEKKADDSLLKGITVHKMPKNYKAGTFSYNEYFDKNGSGSAGAASESSAPKTVSRPVETGDHKKTGLIVIVAGVVVVGLLGYGAYIYLINPSAPKTDQVVKKTPVETSKNDTPKATSTPTTTPITTETPTTTPTSTIVISTSTDNIVSTSSATSTINSGLNEILVIDSDSDGLNDSEEKIIGTNQGLADSDGDTFNDLTEFLNLYNPTGAGKLETNSNIQKHSNPNFKYELLYPKSWIAQSLDNNATSVFTADDQSFVQMVVQVNAKKQNISSWYEEQLGLKPTSGQMLQVGGVEAIKSADGLIVYFSDSANKNIYILSYTPISEKTLVYLNIFNMMVKSFVFSK